MSGRNRRDYKHSMDLYRTDKEWSTFDFDNWLRTHWE